MHENGKFSDGIPYITFSSAEKYYMQLNICFIQVLENEFVVITARLYYGFC